MDDTEEWDRDGQYYHYLTKWAWALVEFAKHSTDAEEKKEEIRSQAAEMMKNVNDKFIYEKDDGYGMYWKMSIDLSRPQVPR